MNAMKKLPKLRLSRAAPKLNRAGDGFTRRKRTVLYPDSCECDARDRKTCPHSCDPIYSGPPGVKLMQSHSPAVLAGVFHDAKVVPGMMIAGSLMGPNEYGTLKGPDDFPDGGRPVPWQFQIAEYEVRESRKGNGQWGIYLRAFNLRLATFSPNSFALRDALGRGFDAAHALKKKRIAEFKAGRVKAARKKK